jgi:hypothetical protein
MAVRMTRDRCEIQHDPHDQHDPGCPRSDQHVTQLNGPYPMLRRGHELRQLCVSVTIVRVHLAPSRLTAHSELRVFVGLHA